MLITEKVSVARKFSDPAEHSQFFLPLSPRSPRVTETQHTAAGPPQSKPGLQHVGSGPATSRRDMYSLGQDGAGFKPSLLQVLSRVLEDAAPALFHEATPIHTLQEPPANQCSASSEVRSVSPNSVS